MAQTAGVIGVNGKRRPDGRRSGLSVWAEDHIKWLLVAPASLLILALTIYPLIFSAWVAFVNYDFAVPGHAFVGLLNFKRVVTDPVAQSSVVVTIIFTVANVTLEFLLGLGLALAMTGNFRGRGTLMAIVIVPLFISPVIVGQFWTLLLQQPFGPTNFLLSKLTGTDVQIGWLTQSPWNFIAIILADVWQWTPFIFVILLAGLTAIPPNLYEAAELDGVSTFEVLRSITLPLLAPMMLLAITFRLLDAVKIFDVIFMITGGGPGTRTYTSSFYLYQTGFQQFHISQATAGSWIFLILIAALIMALVRRLLKAEKFR